MSKKTVWQRIGEAFSFRSLFGSGDVDDAGNAPDANFTRLSADPDRSLPSWTQERVIETAYYQYKTNPLARRLINMTTSYVVGRGIKLRANSPDVQRVLDAFWSYKPNRLENGAINRIRYLILWGESFVPVVVNPANGKCRISYLDPKQISEVKLDPDDATRVLSVRYSSVGSSEPIALAHAQVDPDTGLYEPVTDGHPRVLFWSLDRAPNAERATPDMLAMVDWLDALDTFLLSTVERAQLQMDVCWDVTVKGASEPKLKEFLKRVPAAKPGIVRAHNENVQWQAITPNLGSEDISIYGKELKKYISTCLGYPPHWLGEEGSANRATADEMGVPVVVGLQMLQSEIRNNLREMLDFVVHQALHAGQLEPGTDLTYDVILPTIWGTDTSRVATALVQVSSALPMAVESGWLSQAQAGEIFRYIVGQFGIDLDNVDELTGAAEPDEWARKTATEIANRIRQMPGSGAPTLAQEAADTSPPQAARDEAQRGLDWRREHNRGGTEVGVARARDIAGGRSLSGDTIRRMVSYFARHEVDKQGEGFSPGQPGYPSAGRIAWALWGGDAGRAWAERLADALEDEAA